MTEQFMTISFNSTRNHFPFKLGWQGDESQLAGSISDIRKALLDLNQTTWVVRTQDGIKFAAQGQAVQRTNDRMPEVLAAAYALPLADLGEESFRRAYGLDYACYGGAMANGISSEEMVIALGRAGMMGSYGAGGMSPQRVEEAIHKIQAALPDRPYAFNLLSNPFEPAIEQRTAELYVQHGVRMVEASAYLIPSKSLVYYRASGLSTMPDGSVKIGNKVIAKLSRKEVARKFMAPAPEETLRKLVSEGLITEEQAQLARRVPLADDITVEADSGGHTDNRPLVSLIPSMLGLRDEMQNQHQFSQAIRIGAAGGIATPEAALAAFQMGAAYVVTGSINQACVESGACEYTKGLLAKAGMAEASSASSLAKASTYCAVAGASNFATASGS
jgi:PfaD family protein